MPFNGSGSFALLYNWQTDAANGLDISSSRMQGQDADIASGLSLCLTKDGQQTAIANLPMGGFTLSNIANASALKQPISVQDYQNGTPTWVGVVSGTDTITGAANIAPGAYAAGQKWRGILAGANLTSAVTMNFNGLGAISLPGIAVGALGAGQVFEVTYDGANFQLGNANAHGTLVNVQVITASGTYTPTPGATRGFVRGVAGGGAGGGAQATSGAQIAGGSGGSPGSYGEIYIAGGLTAQTVTIGAAAVGVVGANGNPGAQASFGALLVLPGGPGGTQNGPSGFSGSAMLGYSPALAAAPSGTGNILFSTSGQPGQACIGLGSAAVATLNNGGSSPLGTGGYGGSQSLPASAATGLGAGGGGAFIGISSAAAAGKNGSLGGFIVYEFS